MRNSISPPVQMAEPTGLSGWMTLLLATACGLIAANLYYAQPLIGPISASLGLSPQAAGLIVTTTHIGYGAGLLLVAPLGDLFENRRLILVLLCVAMLALIGTTLSTHTATFLAAALLLGIGSVAVQVLVPYAAHLVPEAARGQVIGNIMSGLMFGIMLARPVASIITEAMSWHAVFAFSALITGCLAIVLWNTLPRREPAPGLSYGTLMASMAQLARNTPVLQRRALYHAFVFGAFSLFWTTVPLLLAQSFHLSQNGIALFALAGVAGAIAAPIAGRIADRGWTRAATGLAMICVAASFLLARMGLSGSSTGLGMLVVAAILLDFGVTANFVLGQRAVFSLDAKLRSRLNGLYMAAFFAGGALCSALGGWTYAQGGWSLSMWVGLALPLLALTCYLTEQ